MTTVSFAIVAVLLALTYVAWRRYLWVAGKPLPTDNCPYSLTEVFGDRLLFPAEFVGRGDMSRGGLLLRAVDAGTELVYVPQERRREYVQRLLDVFLEPRGRLIVCGYGSPRSALAADPVGAELRVLGFEPEEEREAEAPEGGGPIVRIACVRA